MTISKDIDKTMKSFDPYSPDCEDNPDDILISLKFLSKYSGEKNRDFYKWVQCSSCKHADYDKL